jgi:hypothetical protein
VSSAKIGGKKPPRNSQDRLSPACQIAPTTSSLTPQEIIHPQAIRLPSLKAPISCLNTKHLVLALRSDNDPLYRATAAARTSTGNTSRDEEKMLLRLLVPTLAWRNSRNVGASGA